VILSLLNSSFLIETHSRPFRSLSPHSFTFYVAPPDRSILTSVESDAVLELGSIPLPVVTARIDRFITEQGKGPYPDME
jgi:hypothetical protein